MKINPKDDPINNYDGTTLGALRMATHMLFYIRAAYNEGLIKFFGLEEQERLFLDSLNRVGEICVRKVDTEEAKKGLKKPEDEAVH